MLQSTKSKEFSWFLLALLSGPLASSSNAFSASKNLATPAKAHWILADSKLLDAAGVKTQDRDDAILIGLAQVTPEEEARLSQIAHQWRRCGGYQRLSPEEVATPQLKKDLFFSFRKNHLKNSAASNPLKDLTRLVRDPKIQEAVDLVDEALLEKEIRWISSFHDRFHSSKSPNSPVLALEERLKKLTEKARFPLEITPIKHRGTPQNSLRVRIPGSGRPEEIVILGAHFDSINSREGRHAPAPGADDDGSGSANLIEALRVLLQQSQPQSTIEFFWYAAEVGLVGSTEIARGYDNDRKKVKGVLQLDMTMHPGNGEFVIASMTDFTDPKLRQLLTEINLNYLNNVKIVEDRCGYGCSDHAAWFRRGFPTLMPTEALFEDMFPKLHTREDVINSGSSFKHSAVFSKIAVAFAMELSKPSSTLSLAPSLTQ